MEEKVKLDDEKYCCECGVPIKAKAVICPACGCSQETLPTVKSESKNKNKSKTTTIILAILLGYFGVHKFYLKQNIWGIVYFILFWVSGISEILTIIDIVLLIKMSKEEFDLKYNKYLQVHQNYSLIKKWRKYE